MTAPLEHAILGERRERLLADLTGDVLDLGAGTGANLPHLRRAARVVAAEPDPAMRARLSRNWPATRPTGRYRSRSATPPPNPCPTPTPPSTPWCARSCCAPSPTPTAPWPEHAACSHPPAGSSCSNTSAAPAGSPAGKTASHRSTAGSWPAATHPRHPSHHRTRRIHLRTARHLHRPTRLAPHQSHGRSGHRTSAVTGDRITGPGPRRPEA